MTTEQPEALRLAEYWERRAQDLQIWVDENDYVEFGYSPEGLKCEQSDQREAAAELRRLHAENQGQAERIQDIYKQLNDTEKEVDDLRRSQREAWHYSYQLEQERKQLQAMLDHERTENEALLRKALDALAASDDFLFNYHECDPGNGRELAALSEVRENNYAAIELLMERLK